MDEVKGLLSVVTTWSASERLPSSMTGLGAPGIGARVPCYATAGVPVTQPG